MQEKILLSEELLEELKACRTKEEVEDFFKHKNIELSDDDLDKIVGGVLHIRDFDLGSNAIYGSIEETDKSCVG